MRPARRRRTLIVVLISALAHGALIAILATYAPRLVLPRESAGPPQAVIPVLIIPSAPPPIGGPAGKPTPIRLHQRAQRFAPEEVPIPPLVTPEAPPTRAPPAPGPTVIAPPPPDPVGVNARQALRGVVGCSNPDAVGLTREEREKCNDKFAVDRGAGEMGLGLAPDKAGALARAAAKKEADYEYKRGNVPVGTPGGRSDPTQPWRVNVPPTASDKGQRGPSY